MTGRNGLLKRAMDVVISLSAILFLLPVFLGVALAIKLTSKDSIFYLQSRIGLGGKVFNMYKFRTMQVNSCILLEAHLKQCQKSRAEWDKYQKLRNDPRITPVGHFLRKSSIDELPQLLNVLRGTMSIVGPRPILLTQKEIYGAANFANYARTRPGITGLWQVSGRNAIPFEDRIAIEKEYSQKWSLWLDIKILFKTVPTVLFPKGAF